MKVLVITAAYPSPSEPERAVAVENLTRALQGSRAIGNPAETGNPPPGSGLDRPSISCTVVAPRVHASDPSEEVRWGVSVRRFRYPSGERRLKEQASEGSLSALTAGAYLVSGLWSALEEMRRTEPDIVLCHWVVPTGPIAAVAAAIHRRPLVVVAHGSDLNRYADSSRAARVLARLTLRCAALTLAVSADLRRIVVERFSVPAGSVRILPMGADGELFRRPSGAAEMTARREAARRRLGLDPSASILLFVGDLSDEKGVPELVEAHAGLVERGMAVDLCLLGDGPLRREGPLPRLLVPGRVTQRELALWYQAADLLVLPSHSEGTPVVVLEALASGLPVVATRVGGIPDVVEDGAGGHLFAPGDTEGLRRLLERLLGDPAALEAIREHAASSDRDFSAARRAAELAGILEALALKRDEGPAGGAHD